MLRAELRPFGFNPSRLRACACLLRIGARLIPAARCLTPVEYRRTGNAGSAKPAPPPRWAGNWRIRWSLLRQVVRMRAVPDADGSCPSRYEGRFTGIPPDIAMELPRHASRAAPQGAAGAFSPVVGVLTWPASEGEPEQPSGGDAESALSPFELGVVRPKASLCCCESWRWRGLHVCNLPAQIISPPLRGSSRDKLFGLPGAPLRCARKRCGPPVPRRPDHNKDAMGANLVQP